MGDIGKKTINGSKISNFMAINLCEYLPKDLRISLNEEFRYALLSKAIKQTGNQNNLGKILNMTSQNVSEMLHGTVLPTLKTLKSLSNIVKIDNMHIYNNINYITLLRKNGSFKPKLNLDITPEIAEWFGQFLGDGGIHNRKRYTSFTNTEINTVIFHFNISKSIFGITDKQFFLVLKIPKAARNHLNKWKNSFKQLKILYTEPSKNSKKQNLLSGDLLIPNKGLTIYFSAIKSIVLRYILNSNNIDIKRKFISGLYAAEGSLQKYEIFLVMKNRKIIRYIKNLLKETNIHTSKIKKRHDGTYDLRISRRDNIIKFRNYVGFGHHNIKNEKLKHIIETYKEIQLPKKMRYQQILNEIKNNNGMSIPMIANKLKVTYSLAWLRVKELEKMGRITRKNNICYIAP